MPFNPINHFGSVAMIVERDAKFLLQDGLGAKSTVMTMLANN